MRASHAGRWGAVLGAVGLIGCSLDDRLPDNVVVTCDAQHTTCPSGRSCDVLRKRCVSLPVVGDAPMLVGTPVLSPTLARAAQTVTLSFTVDRALSGAPTVELRRFTGAHVGDFTRRSETDAGFVYEYLTLGVEPQEELDVILNLTSADGTPSGDLGTGRVRLDFDPPQVVPGATTSSYFARPGPPAPLRGTVDAVSESNTALVTLAASEPLAQFPTLHTLPDAPSLEFYAPLTAAGQRNFSVRVRLDGGTPPQGDLMLYAKLTDVAGNEADVDAQLTIRVDTVPPAVPDTASPDGITLRRIPFGAAESASPQTSLRVKPMGIDGVGLVARDALTGDPLSQVELDATAGATVRLLSLDYPEVEVAIFDSAGNLSPFARVRNVEYVATLGRKVAQSTLENPHTLMTSRYDTGPLIEARQREESAMSGVAQPGGASLRLTSAEAWRRRDLAPPPDLLQAASCYDPYRRRWVLYGGTATLALTGAPPAGVADTWEWDGVAWHLRTETGPGPRWSAAMAFDERRRACQLFGGVTSTGTLDDLWEWDGVRWLQRAAAARPGGAQTPGMIYDVARDRLVLYAGGQTWEHDGVTWNPLVDGGAPYGALPNGAVYTLTSLSYFAMGYDPLRRRTVLAGGGAPIDVCGPCAPVLMNVLPAIFEYDGQRWSWVDAGFPTLHDGARFSWDEDAGVLLLHGGCNVTETGATARVNETWSWNGAALRPVSDAGPATCLHAQTWDLARRRLTVAGANLNTVASLGAGAWSTDFVRAGPGPRTGVAGAYDETHHEMVVFGGTGEDGGSRDDTWTFDGRAWVSRAVAAPPPYPSPRLVWGGDATYLLAADTWRWDGAAWTPLGFSTSTPAGEVVYDRSNDTLLSPNYGAPVVLIRDAGWQGLDAGALGTFTHAAAFDEARGAVVVLDQSGTLYERRAGTSSSVATGLPAITGLRATYAPSRAQTLFFGGYASPESSDQLLSWNGTAAQTLAPLDVGDGLPLARYEHAWAFDRQRDRAVLFGGTNSRQFALDRKLDDTWELDLTGGLPRATLEVGLHQARIADGATVLDATCRAIVGASAPAADGASMAFWARSAWLPETSHTAAATAPAMLTRSVSGAELAAALGPPRRLSCRLEPRAPRGSGEAVLELDYLELELRYRLP